jgi:Zn-finger nucleic acid-binding protein
MDLTCPKCQAAMRSYERSGVTVDQCSECRGIFLDRGELEKLGDAETSWHDSSPAGQSPRGQAPQHGYPDQGQHQVYGQQPAAGGYRPHKKRKGSFLEGLFE